MKTSYLLRNYCFKMSSTVRGRPRPMTANIRVKKPKTSEPPGSATRPRSRRAFSAKARSSQLTEPNSPVVDLNPPEWLPLLCELNTGIPEKPVEAFTKPVRSPSSTEVFQTRFGCDYDDLDINQDDEDTANEYLEKSAPQEDGDDQDDNTSKSEHEEDSPEKQSQNKLKEFLSAAMDSVRFFLVTSSIGQVHSKETKEKETDSEEEEEEEKVPEVGFSRCELLIKNAALTDKPWRFTIETYRDDPSMLEFYTGFKSYDVISSMFYLVKPTEETITRWQEQETDNRFREGAFRYGIVTLLDEFFMFLYKLRHNPTPEDLALRFCMPAETARNIIDDWLNYLYVCFGCSPVMATRDNTDIYMPSCFRAICPCVRIVIHFATLRLRVPASQNFSKPLTSKPTFDTTRQAQVESVDNSSQNSSMLIPSLVGNQISTLPQETLQVEIKEKEKTERKMSKKKSKLKKFTIETTPITAQSISEGIENPIPKSEAAERRNTKKKFIKEEGERFIEPNDGLKTLKCLVVFQPTGAAALVGNITDTNSKKEDLLVQSGILEMLDECDDILTLDTDDEIQHNIMEEIIHPYALNYMNLKFLTGGLSKEELEKQSPLKAHRLKCMKWHVFHSIKWVQSMKIWDHYADLHSSWVKDVNRVWTTACLLTNFLQADPCHEAGANIES